MSNWHVNKSPVETSKSLTRQNGDDSVNIFTFKTETSEITYLDIEQSYVTRNGSVAWTKKPNTQIVSAQIIQFRIVKQKAEIKHSHYGIAITNKVRINNNACCEFKMKIFDMNAKNVSAVLYLK